jgi:ubiquinone/menaquinone biosynthesis C-methylase UbiE
MSLAPQTVSNPRVRGWLEIRESLERQLEPLGRLAMVALQLAPGERFLDVGCGIGGTPLALANIVGPEGRVVGLELLPDAIEVLRRDAGLPETVSLVCGDAQMYAFEPQSFDAVFSRFGMMFFDEPTAALRNIKRAMRPGGRLSFVCWRGLDENELDEFPLRTAAPYIPSALVTDTVAAPWFSFSDRSYLKSLLAEAGFSETEITPHDVCVSSGSMEGMVAVLSRVGALGAILREHPYLCPEAVEALERALGKRNRRDAPQLRAAIWVVSARVPADH